jgi:hypothetical protein
MSGAKSTRKRRDRMTPRVESRQEELKIANFKWFEIGGNV